MKRVNFSEEAHDKKSNKSRTGLIKVSNLSNNISKQSDPRLAWIMFHKVAHIYRDITKQETVQALIIIQGLHVNLESTKDTGMSPETPILYMPLKPIMNLDSTLATTVLEDLK